MAVFKNDLVTRQTLRPVSGSVPWRPSRELRDPDDLRFYRNQILKIKKVPIPVKTTSTTDPSGKGGVPKKLLSIAAVESPSKQQDRTFSLVSITFTRDSSD